jgi:hypothetical protein
LAENNLHEGRGEKGKSEGKGEKRKIKKHYVNKNEILKQGKNEIARSGGLLKNLYSN